MSLSMTSFWQNVATAAQTLQRAGAAGGNGDANQAAWDCAELWLTPSAVADFNADDFWLLPKAERERLCQSVAEFRNVARKVSPDEPATDEQSRQALAYLREVFELLTVDQFPDAEAFQIAKLLESMRLPDWVVERKWQLDIDSIGEPAVYIWIIVQDDEAKKPGFHERTLPVRQTVQTIIRQHGVVRWPYINFRTASEESDIKEGRIR